MAAAKKLRTKEQIIEDLDKKCREIIANKKHFRFYTNAFSRMVKAVSNIVVDGHMIRLRYSENTDTPFVDMQPNGLTRVGSIIFNYESIEGGNFLNVSPNQMCKLKYLLLHGHNVANGFPKDATLAFWLEDKKKDANREYETYLLKDKAIKYVMESTKDELAAAYFLVTGGIDEDMEKSEYIIPLRKVAESDPESVIEAFEDEDTKIKFQFQTAVKCGIIIVNAGGNECRWRTGNSPILSVVHGEEIIDEFPAFTRTDKGKGVYDKMIKELTK